MWIARRASWVVVQRRTSKVTTGPVGQAVGSRDALQIRALGRARAGKHVALRRRGRSSSIRRSGAPVALAAGASQNFGVRWPSGDHSAPAIGRLALGGCRGTMQRRRSVDPPGRRTPGSRCGRHSVSAQITNAAIGADTEREVPPTCLVGDARDRSGTLAIVSRARIPVVLAPRSARSAPPPVVHSNTHRTLARGLTV
jgi:hypothetical protein